MERDNVQNGYVIQLYKCAYRYRYNYEGFLRLFNYAIDKRKKRNVETYTLESDFLAFGDFDYLQIMGVDSFRKYHDVPDLAKDWLGKRQTVLLYSLSDERCPSKVFYDEKKRIWFNVEGEDINRTFFCFSMFSLTNEIVEKTGNSSKLLCSLRERILSIVERINEKANYNLVCEVFGTFNTSELCVVWLSDQYTEVLQILDYIKHIKMTDNSVSEESYTPVFLDSFSIFAIKGNTALNKVNGRALIQIIVHDEIEGYTQLREFANALASENGHIYYSVGEYDVVIETSAERAIKEVQDGILSIGEREADGSFKETSRSILKSNVRLLYEESQTERLKCELDQLFSAGLFHMKWGETFAEFRHSFEWEELKQSDEEYLREHGKSNEDYFQSIRSRLKERVSPSAGAVDTLDLLYADYHSVVSTAYSAMWVSDLHRQFKAVLYAIEQLISSDEKDWSWDDFRELSNVFKQQIYHLSQSNRLFFEIPSSHLRATGQYDFLMHAYYGMTKSILETIYLIQGEDAQSELVPLITVNTVPQVKTQLYFEIGNDDCRAINLDIPNSIIFDLQRGLWYLTHELFHYSVPLSRKKRNRCMAKFLLHLIFKMQFRSLLKQILSVREDGTIDLEAKEIVDQMLSEKDVKIAGKETAALYMNWDASLVEYIEANFEDQIWPKLYCSDDSLSCACQLAIYQFAESDESQDIFESIFLKLLPDCVCWMKKQAVDYSDLKSFQKVKDRLIYCQINQAYVHRFIETDSSHRFFNSEQFRYTEIAMEHWSAVREACSDIAMISFNGLNIVDYAIFCIQAWTDTSGDRHNVLKKMKDEVKQSEWIRYGLVTAYLLREERTGWTDYVEIRTEKESVGGYDLTESVKDEFRKRFVWLYADKTIKYPSDRDKDRTYLACGTLFETADRWLYFFACCRRYYSKFYLSYYSNLLFGILADFDLENRIKCLQENHDERASQLELIRNGILEHVYKPYAELFINIPRDIEGMCQAIKTTQIRNLDASNKTKRFQYDISVAQYFQKQKSLSELAKKNDEVRKNIKDSDEHYKDNEIIAYDKRSEKTDEKDIRWEFHVYSLTELMSYLKYCSESLRKTAESPLYNISEDKSTMIWFRGHASEKFTNLPTVMRSFNDETMKRYRTLRNYQLDNFEEFKCMADGAPEMPLGLKFTESDYIALMQHYEFETNFLDWTENVFISLYFALEEYYDTHKRDAITDKNPSLFLFHPEIYNKIRRNSQAKYSLEEFKNELKAMPFQSDWAGYLQYFLDPKVCFTNMLPNLSTETNENIYSMFLFGNIAMEERLKNISEQEYEKFMNRYLSKIEDMYMPMAILTSRLNQRIRTQSGRFVAYNIYTPPKTDNQLNGKPSKATERFAYISLEEIQKRKAKEGIFMYKLVIDQSCCLEIAEWLKAAGISKANVYPELRNKKRS